MRLINEFWRFQTSTRGAKSMWSATDKVKLYFNESKSFGNQCSEHSQFNDTYPLINALTCSWFS